MNAKTMSDRTIQKKKRMIVTGEMKHCLLYTSDAADD